MCRDIILNKNRYLLMKKCVVAVAGLRRAASGLSGPFGLQSARPGCFAPRRRSPAWMHAYRDVGGRAASGTTAEAVEPRREQRPSQSPPSTRNSSGRCLSALSVLILRMFTRSIAEDRPENVGRLFRHGFTTPPWRAPLQRRGIGTTPPWRAPLQGRGIGTTSPWRVPLQGNRCGAAPGRAVHNDLRITGRS